MSFVIKMGDAAASYDGPFEGGAPLLPFQGFTYAKIVEVTPGKSAKGNQTLEFDMVCEEEPGVGFSLFKSQACTGLRSDGKENVLGLLDIVNSVYSTLEGSDSAAKERVRTEFAGKDMDAAGIIENLKGQRVYLEIAARAYVSQAGKKGWSTEVKNFIGRDRYTAQKAAGGHHRANPPESAEPTAVSAGPAQVMSPPPGAGLASSVGTNGAAGSGKGVI